MDMVPGEVMTWQNSEYGGGYWAWLTADTNGKLDERGDPAATNQRVEMFPQKLQQTRTVSIPAGQGAQAFGDTSCPTPYPVADGVDASHPEVDVSGPSGVTYTTVGDVKHFAVLFTRNDARGPTTDTISWKCVLDARASQ